MVGAQGLFLFTANKYGHSSYKTFRRFYLSAKYCGSLPAFLSCASSAGNDFSSLLLPWLLSNQAHTFMHMLLHANNTHTYTSPLLNSYFSSGTSTLYKSFPLPSKKKFEN